MKEFMVGAGGWAYFQIPGTHPLRAYAKIYDFVEVNSSFYVIPDMKRVKRWRGMVPHTFKFTVRCHRSISHKFKFAVLEQPLQIFERMIEICNTLKAEILHVLFPKTLQPTSQLANSLRNFIESAKTNGVRLAVEFRGNNVQFDKAFIRLMEDYNMIHSVDLSKDERPVVESDILYSRLFGKGEHNIYQPTDEELRRIDQLASEGPHQKVMLCFHYVKMYKDAVRFKIYKQTGKFPKVTSSKGLESLAEVLREDAVFPATRQELISSQGWKIIDLTNDKRVHAAELLKKLRNKTYSNIEEVIKELSSTSIY